MKLDDFDDDADIVDMCDDELFELLDQIDYEKENQEISEIESDFKTCSKCNSPDKIVEDSANGIFVCVGCGSVICDIYDSNPEWKQYDDGKDVVGRCSNPTNFFLPLSSLGTSIAGAKSKIKILHGWSAMPYRERSLHGVLKEIQSKCRANGIVKYIEDDAKILYKNLSESKHPYGKNVGKNIIIRGANRKSLIAACVFFACKRKGNTRSPKEISKLFGLKYKDITKGCKTFMRFMKIRSMKYDIQISNPEHFITRYCKELHIANEYIGQTVQIAKNIKRLNIASMHTPFSVATGSILLVVDINNLNIDRKFIATKFGVSEVTVTKTYKKIEQYRPILVNDELTIRLAELLEEERKKLKVPERLQNIYDKIIEEEELESDSEEEILTINNNNIDDYFSNANIDMYDALGETEIKYKEMFYEIYNIEI